MKLVEKVKSFFNNNNNNKEHIEKSSDVDVSKVLNDFSHDSKVFGTFFDNTATEKPFWVSANGSDTAINFNEIIRKQADKIHLYRNTALEVDVSKAIDEIVNETIYVVDDEFPLKISILEENEKISEKITQSFDKILSLLDIKVSIFDIIKRSFIDGQIILHCSYDNKKIANGIQEIKMIDPVNFYYDQKEKLYKYLNNESTFSIYNTTEIANEEYSDEEIVRGDFGLSHEFLNLSYLEPAIKPTNQLKLLEDMLIPMRFSRSISRRVFNVDIGDLPAKRGEEVMRQYLDKFKYKKYYDNKTGEITNQSHVTSMVEDYWFANRSGGKGTTVDVLDETGNLGEINDILYFLKKVYRSLNIPSSRIDINPEADKTFDFTSTQTTKEDIAFFMFISRIRKVYIKVFKELLKRELISTGTLKENEWEEFSRKINIFFTNENTFVERMKLENLNFKMEIYNSLQEQQGKIFPVQKLLKDVFRFSDEEIERYMSEIEKEKKSKLFGNFYVRDEEY